MGTSILLRGRQSSIELEPRTLTLEQLKYAREAALFVLRTTTQEQAISIFTEGLKPVAKTTNRFELVMEAKDEKMGYDLIIDSDDHEDELLERDVATAPF